MSNETRAALETALRNHFTDDSGGGLLTEWLILATGASSKDVNVVHYTFEESASPLHSLHGLAKMGVRYIDDLQDVDECDHDE